MTSRASIILPSGDDSWRVANLTAGLMRVARQLARDGFEVDLILPPDFEQARCIGLPEEITRSELRFTEPAIVAGPGMASVTASLKVGHQLWRHLSASPPDIVLAPLVGGVLQPSLMSRAVCESLGGTVFVVLAEASTTERLRLGDIEPATPAALVDDALETTTLRLVDAVIGFRQPDAGGGAGLQCLPLAMPWDDSHSPPAAAPATSFDELVFVGPASARHGAPQFLAEIERLGHAGALAGRQITFLGPWREGPLGLGKAMLGRRARDWSFLFTQRDDSRLCRFAGH